MAPHTSYFTGSVPLDVSSCQHAAPCYSSSCKGPLSVDLDVVEDHQIHHNRPRKCVSFNELVRAKKTIHISDFTAEEVRSCWYQDEDYELMKRDLCFEVNLIDNDCIFEKPNNMTHTPCGLELFSSSMIGQARRQIKEQGHHAVLDEQRLQREEGSYDPEFIADIYSAVTKAANQLAIQRAAC